MKRKVNPFAIGLLVLVGGGIALGTLIFMGATQILHKSTQWAAYFDRPVSGLEVGAPVDRLGVEVGHVSSIDLVDGGRYVRVEISLPPHFQMSESYTATLHSNGLTGSPVVTLIDSAPGARQELVPEGSGGGAHVIPTLRQGTPSLEEGIAGIYHKIEDLDLQGLVAQWQGAGHDLATVLSGDDVEHTLANLRESSSALRGLLDDLGSGENRRRIDESLAGIANTVAEMRSTVGDVENQVDAVPPEALANLLRQADDLLAGGRSLVDSFDSRTGNLAGTLDVTLHHLDELIGRAESLARALSAEPGRLLEPPAQRDPFDR